MEQMVDRIAKKLQGPNWDGSHMEGWWTTGNYLMETTVIIKKILQQCEAKKDWLGDKQEANGTIRNQQLTIMEWWTREARKKFKETVEDNAVILHTLLFKQA
eukprot:c30017_g1_i1 orf=349-654(+)